MSELRQSNPAEPGIVRRRRGRGFSYHRPGGAQVRDSRTLARIRALAIPPAWTDVWICRSPDGHIQAVGTDTAGRRQYRYHDVWRREQDRAKFDRVLEMAERLPKFRERVAEHLEQRGLTRERVLAAAARMLDIGFFRVGGESYESFGLATLRMEHVTCSGGRVSCAYPAKGGKFRELEIVDADVCKVVTALRRSADEGELLRYRDGDRWTDVRSDDINAYLRETLEMEASAKDFRTWHATVLAAVGLAVSLRARSRSGRKRAVNRVIKEVAGYLGNTPAVARASYVDPRVVEAFERGRTVAGALGALGADAGYGQLATHGGVERAVISLLRRARG
ncbi:DNA topoisomerase IB [Streptosporangium becharense]|uniref:DNA topoisomerase IB n=1 Tax=Streptosporangium becharense TaxID=1816182 RepID=A0A7W9IBN0_9ACTN|nr:DNA topoisomerase IB [Streptosporangium becharense]MBB2913689.1 DNA topoisomerase IB [Streptosporangium becharense]MBB5817770.1 DNA topoisomerase IB [Streptosporangium becharense]